MKKNVFLAAAMVLGTMLMGTPVFAGNYGWNRDGRGWWYQLLNGSYVKSSWLSINGTWYSMNSAGYMETGWVRDDGGWYYMDTESGAMRVGWVNVNGNWYYLNPADGGRMLANSYTPDGYYVDGNGVYQPQSKRQTTTVNRTVTDNTDTIADDATTWQRSNAGNDSASPEEYEDQVIALVNQERAKEGLSPVKKDAGLTNTADVRAAELEVLFSHDRPDGSDCFTAYPRGFGYKGENIAAGQRNPEEVMDSWMHSSGHRANILNPNYDSIGVGYSAQDGTPHWVQNFGRKN
ncbi:CAP domain-containing protein [Stomatobaculum longum]|uniref:CAP domain-containing protein n=1 Tax=Stomatobaculum longum TaxID=796942 RepID=UPI00280505E5|nr:CAP domain-containing protein [Stomatobaculum longum]